MTRKSFLALGCIYALFSAATVRPQSGSVPPEVSEDSEIVLQMEGAVTATLRISTRGGSSLVSKEGDGEVETASMSEDDCIGLWEFCLRRDAMALESARPEKVYPDSSAFDLSFRIGSETHRFSAQGVEQLSDTRYREIVGQILSICSRYLKGLEG